MYKLLRPVDNTLDCSQNTRAPYQKGHLLGRLRSFEVCRILLCWLQVVFYVVVCWGGGGTGSDRKWQEGWLCPGHAPDSKEDMGERRMLTRVMCTMDNICHPCMRLCQPRCRTERYHRSFIMTAIRLYNTHSG